MKLDRNGYRESLFETETGECYVCHRGCISARHEILHGPRRANSKRYGLWVNLCPHCHDEVHREDNGKYLYLKKDAQRLFEETFPDKDFLAIFGVNYL